MERLEAIITAMEEGDTPLEIQSLPVNLKESTQKWGEVLRHSAMLSA